jgi:hypothetical protein
MASSQKTRRKSIGNNIAYESKCILGESEEGYTTIIENEKMSRELIDLYGTSDMEVIRVDLKNLENRAKFQSLLEKGEKRCVGMYFNYSIHHAIPYVLIGGEWYNGDNEFGYLRKLTHSPPSTYFRYRSRSGKLYNKSVIVECLLFYCDSKLISQERFEKDFTGTPCFGQTKQTCGPDSIQTIFMYADGFYELFTKFLYENLKKRNFQVDSRFSYSKIKENPYELEDLEEEVDRLLPLYPPIMRQAESEAPLRFLTLMFIRYYSYETMPEEARNYTIVPNNSVVNENLVKQLHNVKGGSSVRTRKAKLKSHPPY